MKLSIIILNYNTKHLLRLCLKNLLELELSFPCEIIVVDNASKDGSAGMMEKNYSQIKLIISEKNVGHAAGNNLGIKAATGEYVLILNTDIIFRDKKEMDNILHFLDIHPEIGILGPKLLNGNGTIQYSCYRRYNALTPIYRRTPLGNLAFAKEDLQRHLMWDFDHLTNKEVEWILGACMFIRKSFLDAHGNFDQDFFLYFADYELCDRARRNGLKVFYYSEANIVHYHKRESAQGSIWSGMGSLFNYTTRIHIKDWFKYLSKQRKYENFHKKK
jgi:hypothetical protein